MTSKTGQRESSSTPPPRVFKAKNVLLFGAEYRSCGLFFWYKRKTISTTRVTQTFLSADFRQVGGCGGGESRKTKGCEGGELLGTCCQNAQETLQLRNHIILICSLIARQQHHPPASRRAGRDRSEICSETMPVLREHKRDGRVL